MVLGVEEGGGRDDVDRGGRVPGADLGAVRELECRIGISPGRLLIDVILGAALELERGARPGGVASADGVGELSAARMVPEFWVNAAAAWMLMWRVVVAFALNVTDPPVEFTTSPSKTDVPGFMVRAPVVAVKCVVEAAVNAAEFANEP
jgi:hypothetical protein